MGKGKIGNDNGRDMVNGKQRVLAAMKHQPVDRAPVMCQLAVGHYLLNTDVRPVELWYTSEGFAKALIALQQRYSFDGILINLPGSDPDGDRHVLRVDTEADGSQVVHFRNGDMARCPHDDNVHHFPASGRKLPTLQEVDPDKLFYDEPHGLGGLKYPFYFGLKAYEATREDYWPAYLFRTIDLIVQQVGHDTSVHSEIFSPWTQLMELFGYEQALMYMLDDPDRVHAILRATRRVRRSWACGRQSGKSTRY